MHDFITLPCNRFHTIFSLWASQYSCPTVNHFYISILHSSFNMCEKSTFPFSSLCFCSCFCSPAKRLINLICKSPFRDLISQNREKRRLIPLWVAAGGRQTRCSCMTTLSICLFIWAKMFWLWNRKTMHQCFGLTIIGRSPVVLRPPKNVIVLSVLLLQPLNERVKIVHQWLGTHFGLAGDHGHSLWPGLTGTQFHYVTGRRSAMNICCRHNYTHVVNRYADNTTLSFVQQAILVRFQY